MAAAYAAAAAGLLALPPAWALAGAAVALPALARDLARAGRAPRLCWHADGTWSTGPAARAARSGPGPSRAAGSWCSPWSTPTAACSASPWRAMRWRPEPGGACARACA
ncbi:MAG: hypothetical protein U5K43_08970 [Halofilum sp. (in: g-proteobacteria)]|nr:hypothetical protein [Halofilum sp. (in: g-proteobacteria)]